MNDINKTRSLDWTQRCRPSFGEIAAKRAECLEQLLEAIADINERDDIHQAARRLACVQEWISQEAEQAAADPIFDVLKLAS